MYSVIEERDEVLKEIVSQCFPHRKGGDGESSNIVGYAGGFDWDGNVHSLPVPDKIKALITYDPGKGARSNSIMSVINALVKANVKVSDIFRIFEEQPIGIKWRKEHRSKRRWLEQHIVKASMKFKTPNGGPQRGGDDTLTSSPGSFPFTDLGNAERFAAQHGENVRFCHTWGKWLIWNGKRWEVDETNRIVQLAKHTVRQMYAEASVIEDYEKRMVAVSHARKSESAGRIQAMIALAQSEQPIAITSNQLDTNLWLLNVENGTINLQTGDFYPHRRGDLITKMAPVTCDPSANKPLEWLKFLGRIMAESQDLIAYLQKLIGYCLTGDTREKCLPVAYGTGDNGKTILAVNIAAMLGDYARDTPIETLMAKNSESIPNDLARLQGARFVTASEGERGQKLAESLIKRLTGGDKISARFLHQEWFEFIPEFKIWLSTNHKPVIRGGDNAIWNRIHLIPFNVSIPKNDQIPRTKMLAALRQEWPGILNWAIEGCALWQQDGLQKPQEVIEATENYRADSDIIGGFISDMCTINPLARCTKSELRTAYENWCASNKEAPLSTRNFKSILTERGIKDCKIGHRAEKGWAGIGFKKAGPQVQSRPNSAVFSHESDSIENYRKNRSASVRTDLPPTCDQCANFQPNTAENASHGHCGGIPPDGDKLRFPNVEVDCCEFREKIQFEAGTANI